MQVVAKLADLRGDRGLRVEIGDEKILLIRDGDHVRAYSALCPHAQGPLDEGAVCNGHIVCPWHKGTFRVSDGGLTEPPALEGLARYQVRVDGEDVLASPEMLPPLSTALGAPDRAGQTVLIVGAGAAGAAGAAALREFGFSGRILMAGRETWPPFDRTALSKFVTAGQMKPDEVPPLLPDAFFEDQRIERLGAAVDRIDVGRSLAVLKDGRECRFSSALIATGGTPRSIDIPGSDLAGVHRLRTREDAAAILSDVRKGGRAVLIGSGFIGLEVACGLRAQGVDVTVLSPEDTPLARQFGDRVGRSLRALHEANGVRFHTGAKAERLEGDGRVRTVVAEDGARLEADFVMAALGIQPATDMLEGIALEQDGGVAVDPAMRIAGSVFAAGDIAAFPLPGGGRARVEHWRVAQQHARVAARNIAGAGGVYDGVPFFWTYHYEKRFEYLGHADAWEQELVEGDVERQDFVMLLVRSGLVAAVVACGRERVTARLAERLRAPVRADEAFRIVRAG